MNLPVTDWQQTRPVGIIVTAGAAARGRSVEDVDLGSLTPGKYADIVALSRNIMTVPDDEIPTAKVDLTILGGKVRYERRTTTTAARAGANGR
jgi:imidazolonepropionase-like amidohydrolase